MYKNSIAIITLATFMGCSPVHKVQFQSNPSGAMIYCDGEAIGTTPRVVRYELTAQQEEEEILRLKECKAQWISGAKKEVETIEFKLPQVHFSSSTYLFTRPEFPNYKADKDFAIRAKMLEEMEYREREVQERRENYRDEANAIYYDDDYRGYNHGYDAGYNGGYSRGSDNARMHVSH